MPLTPAVEIKCISLLDAVARHIALYGGAWTSSLIQYLVGTEPNILNKGNEPTFVISSRKENTVD